MPFRPPDWPDTCPNGHRLEGGTAHYGGYTICDTCPGPAGSGHHYVTCNTCNARLWLHPGAVWEVWTGHEWVPA